MNRTVSKSKTDRTNATERNGIVALQPSESNASVILGEIFYFAVQDPQMVFDLSGLAGGVVLSARADMEFLHKGRKAMENYVALLQKILKRS